MHSIPTVCPCCKGVGVVPAPDLTDEPFLDEVCDRCGGEGWIEDEEDPIDEWWTTTYEN